MTAENDSINSQILEDSFSDPQNNGDDSLYCADRKMLTLNDICVCAMLRGGFPNSIEEAANLALKIPNIASLSNYRELWHRILTLLKQRGSMLFDCYDEEELEKCFGGDVISSLKNLNVECIAAKKTMANYRGGKAIEREVCNLEDSAQTGYFPIAALLAGVSWPKNVNPSKREEYLTSDDFFRVFLMSKEDFKLLPMHVRTAMKKSKKFF